MSDPTISSISTRIAVLCNAHSNRNKLLLPELSRICQNHGLQHSLLDKFHSLKELLDDFQRQQVSHLIVNGGDGTVQAVTSMLIHRQEWRPKIILLNGGMTNIIAHDIGEKRDPIKGLDISIQKILNNAKGETQTRSTIKISDIDQQHMPNYGFLIGGMSFYSATMSSRKNVHRLGFGQMLAANLSLGWSVLGAILGNHEKQSIVIGEKISYEIDGQGIEDGHIALFLGTTLHRLLPLAHPFWGEGPGNIKATMIDYPPRQLWRAAIPILRGRSNPWMEKSGYRSFNADRILLKSQSPFIMDGETIIPPPGGLLLERGPDIEFTRYE